jgi:hypothetical protein
VNRPGDLQRPGTGRSLRSPSCVGHSGRAAACGIRDSTGSGGTSGRLQRDSAGGPAPDGPGPDRIDYHGPGLVHDRRTGRLDHRGDDVTTDDSPTYADGRDVDGQAAGSAVLLGRRRKHRDRNHLVVLGTVRGGRARVPERVELRPGLRTGFGDSLSSDSDLDRAGQRGIYFHPRADGRRTGYHQHLRTHRRPGRVFDHRSEQLRLPYRLRAPAPAAEAGTSDDRQRSRSAYTWRRGVRINADPKYGKHHDQFVPPPVVLQRRPPMINSEVR